MYRLISPALSHAEMIKGQIKMGHRISDFWLT